MPAKKEENKKMGQWTPFRMPWKLARFKLAFQYYFKRCHINKIWSERHPLTVKVRSLFNICSSPNEFNIVAHLGDCGQWYRWMNGFSISRFILLASLWWSEKLLEKALQAARGGFLLMRPPSMICRQELWLLLCTICFNACVLESSNYFIHKLSLGAHQHRIRTNWIRWTVRRMWRR